jgi:hypothetical protein
MSLLMKRPALMRASKAMLAMACVAVPGLAQADWKPAEELSAGAVSIGAGTLALIATPIVIPAAALGAVVDGNNPSTAAVEAGLSTTVGSAALMGTGLVMLVDGTGRGLGKLTVDSLESSVYAAGEVADSVTTVATNVATSVKDSVPRVTVTWPEKGQVQKKSIPLVVRSGYVEMNEKLEDQPCP